jgi:hypothetical protein
MVFGALSRLGQMRVTVGYAVALLVVTIALLILGPEVQDRVIKHVSTNLHNLSRGHLGTLLGSAFVVDAGPIYVWLPGLVCLLALAELLWRSWRLILAFATGHIGATLLVAAGLVAAVEAGWGSQSVARASDVGMSYGAAAVLGSLTPALPRRWRQAWAGWWLGVALASAVVGHDFTDVGHAVALLLGMLVSTRFGTPGRWTSVRWVMLAVTAGFGYLMLANTQEERLLGAALGALGALIADRIGALAQRNSSALASIQSERQEAGGSSRSSPGISHS